MSSSFQEYLDSIDITYEEIASATNNFASENIIPQGSDSDSSVKLYKGQLLLSGQLIDIVALGFRRVNRYVKEMHMSYVLHQKNLASVVGYCQDNLDELLLVKKHFVNGSLDKHLSGSSLTWMQRLHICVGVSQALSWLHYNDVLKEAHYMIHGDIKSSKILLDDNWEPKLQGSKFSMAVKRHHLHVISKDEATLQYMDPAYETTGGLTHKSDVFSFGVVLFEVLFGRKAFISDNDNWHFARLARLHFEEKRLDEMIDNNLREQMDFQSLEIFSETAYFCLKEERSQRPDMNQIVKRLERALECQKKHESPEQSITTVEGSSSNHLKVGKILDHLRIPLSDIKLATKNFSETNCIGSGGYGKVYKAELSDFDGRSSSTTKGKNNDESSTRHNTVAIKHIISRTDKQGEQGFLAEIEMLSNCKHPNIISLLGFCDEDSEMILVYEYASNGSLDDYFGNDDNIINLTWAQRIQMCLHIAHGLKYLHTSTKDKQKIIHRDIKSANILLDDNWVAKIADFGLSKLQDVNHQGSTFITCNIAGTEVYLDPEYWNTGKLKKASDIYSFGVVMFEIFCGRLAYDKSYGDKGLPSVVRQCFNEGTLNEMADPKIKEADILNRRFYQDSLDTFSKIAYQCLAETQAQRPTIEVIITELEKAFDFQTNLKDNLKKSLEEIKAATRNFDDRNCIGEGMFWKLYEGKVWHDNSNRCTTIVAKRWDSKSLQCHHQFWKELEILSTRKHENIIRLVGYCSEMDEKIIVYEQLSNGRLDKHLDDPSLTWMRRLKICIDAASGLDFLHGDNETNALLIEDEHLIHRDLKSSNILLDGEWKAKLSNLELSSKCMAFEEIQHATDNPYGSLDYIDPNYKQGYLTKESDIYSLGVILMEILCGRLIYANGYEDCSQLIGHFIERKYEEGSFYGLVFEGIRDHIQRELLTTFLRIALLCLKEDMDDRPRARVVVEELKIALRFQDDHEIWEPKLPKDYEEIFQMSKSPKIIYETKKDLYNMLTKGILLQDGKMWFSLGTKGERNEMISAKFSLKSRRSHNWVSLPTSRFQKVAMMSDHSKTKIKINTQFLCQGVSYGIYLVFKFWNTRKVSAAPVYMNLMFKMGNETLHSYFATWRNDEWMMIELCRCFTHKEEAVLKVIVESFSRHYCKSDAIYIEGIEFREINISEHDQIERLKAAEHESPTAGKGKPKTSQFYDLFSPRKLNEREHYILSGKEVLYDSSKMKFVISKPSAESRFKEVIELLAQQVLHIKCKIESQMLSPSTEYACYLVFKLSKKCCGLHCPVILRDLLSWNNKETEVLYFRSPSPINRHNINRIPENREDGCMEVCVWKGHSDGKFKNGSLPLNLKLISYEGTMSGLIVYGLEFRTT